MIAERVLRLNDRGGAAEVSVRVFAPEQEKQSWSCRYEILWPDGKRASAAYGSDSIQALLFALQMIGAELHTTDHHQAGRLFWNEPGSGYGFPVTQNLRDLLVGDDAKFL